MTKQTEQWDKANKSIKEKKKEREEETLQSIKQKRIDNYKRMYTHAGRPATFDSPQALQDKIDEYFAIKVASDYPSFSIVELALFCWFSDRASFYDYGKRPEFSHTIKRARSIIESEYEQLLKYAKNPTGAIFWLKQVGWKDQQTVEHTGVNGWPVIVREVIDMAPRAKLDYIKNLLESSNIVDVQEV